MDNRQPIIVIERGESMNFLQKVQALGIIIGIGFGGYIIYEIAFSDPCDSGIIGKNGIIGQFLPYNPFCEVTSILNFFKGLKDIGIGVPVELEDCPAGWTNDGLTCREPLGWNDNCVWWDWGALGGYYTGCATGGKVIGRLDHGGNCPADHPEKIDGLCYRTCPKGYVHTEGMPYTCRNETGGNFWDAITKGFNF